LRTLARKKNDPGISGVICQRLNLGCRASPADLIRSVEDVRILRLGMLGDSRASGGEANRELGEVFLEKSGAGEGTETAH
jgi:hypothetical protein